LRIGAKPDRQLLLNAFGYAHLPRQGHEGVNVRVYCGDKQIAEWKFSPSEAEGNRPRWLSAPLPASEQLDDILEIILEIEGATSPYAEGLSGDRRVLGLGLFKLSITAGR
jgi:hypothetical protein